MEKQRNRMKKFFYAAFLLLLAFFLINLETDFIFAGPVKSFRVIDAMDARDVPPEVGLHKYTDLSELEKGILTDAVYEVYSENKFAMGFISRSKALTFYETLDAVDAYVIKKGILWTLGDSPEASLDRGSFSVFYNRRFMGYFESFSDAMVYARLWNNAVIAGEMVIKNDFPVMPGHRLHTVKKYESYGTLAEAVAAARNSNGHKIIIAVGSEDYDRDKIIWENLPPSGSAAINGVPFIHQLPELPRGCEVTALAMLINFRGLMVDKNDLAVVIKKSPLRYDDPNNGFIGDMYSLTTHGLGVYHMPIAELARGYMPREIIDISGCEIEDLLYFLDRERPVWVLTNSRFAVMPDSEFVTWNTPDGAIKVTNRMHAVVITGYDERFFYYHDPNVGPNQKQPRGNFSGGWVQMGRQAVTIY